ncbi:phage tail protein [Planococcus sp. FY231025]|uniref:phage tail protein n=1 Tax=Planococcus sp. FY231025 TaxID=3455699 RepID=UPI003F8F3747
MAYSLTAVLELRDNMSRNLRGAVQNINSAGDTVSNLNNKMNTLAKAGMVAVGAGAVAAGAGIAAMGKNAIEAAADSAAMTAQFEQVFGDLAPAAQKAIDGMSKEFDSAPNRLKPAMSQMTSMFKGLGIDTEEAMAMATSGVTMASDAAAFYDKSFADANSALNSFIKGSYEGGESIGLFGSAATMTAYASKELGKDFDKLDEAGKQIVRLKFAQSMQERAGATGQAARESDSLSNQLGNVKQLWTDVMAKLGEGILPIAIGHIKTLATTLKNFDVQPIVNGIDTTINRFIALKAQATPVIEDIIAKVKEFASTIKTNWEPIKDVLAGIGAAALTAVVAIKTLSAINAVTTAFKAFKASAFAATWATKGFSAALLMNPVGLIVIALVALVGTIVYLVNRFDWAKDAMNTVWSAIKTGFSAVMEWLKPYVTATMDVVMSAFNAVKNYIGEVMPMISTIIKFVWSIIGPLIKHNLTIILNVVKLAFNTIKDVIGWALNNVLNIIKTVWGVISGLFKTALQLLTGDWSGAWETMKETAVTAFSNLGELFSEWIGGALDIGKNFITGIVDGFLAVWDSLVDTARSIWDSVTGIFDEKKTVNVGVNAQTTTGGVLNGRAGNPRVDGSHYNGLDKVPYNGYVAKLHKGERVMTADENKVYSAGGNNVVNLSVVYNGGQKLDQQEMDRFSNYLAKQLAQAGAGGA